MLKVMKIGKKILSEKDLINLEKLISTHPNYDNYGFEKSDLQIFRNINKNKFGFFRLKYNPGSTGALGWNGYSYLPVYTRVGFIGTMGTSATMGNGQKGGSDA